MEHGLKGCVFIALCVVTQCGHGNGSVLMIVLAGSNVR